MKGDNIIYGTDLHGTYSIIEDEAGRRYVVFSNYHHQEEAIVFELASSISDWSEDMLLDTAKSVVDFLNKGRL